MGERWLGGERSAYQCARITGDGILSARPCVWAGVNTENGGALPVGLHEEVWWELRDLVMLDVQDLHRCSLQPFRKPRQLVVSCQQFPETTIAKQAV